MGLLLAVLVTAACVVNCRRLTVDWERSTLSSEEFIKIRMIQLLLNRVKPKGGEAEFHYRMAARSPYGTVS